MVDNQRVSCESEAKAILKGESRIALGYLAEIGEKRREGVFSDKMTPRKIHNFWLEELHSYGSFLVSVNNFRGYGVSSSKHFKSEYSAIEPEFEVAEGYGNLCKFVYGFIDSKRFCKRDMNGYVRLISQFYFDEHFLYRCIYRLNTRQPRTIGQFVFPIIKWLVIENISLSRFDDFCYFVYPKHVICMHKMSNSKGVIFKTVLEREHFNEEQSKLFSDAILRLENSEMQSIAGVMTNSLGQVVRAIPKYDSDSLLNGIHENSLWLQHTFTSPDARGEQKSLLEKLADLKG